MLLSEILNITHLPYKWISNTIGTFEFNNHQFGIVLEDYHVQLPTHIISIVNISFGLVIDSNEPISPTNIDRALTKFGNPRTILATVGNACVNNPHLQQYDIIMVAASDQVKEKRIGVYVMAINELITHLKQYQYSYRAHTPNNSILVVTSKIKLSQDEIDFISTEVLHKQ
ncbi:hypothetical protein M0R04_07200 [Candidatus Dojkabacteria bacterium]|jgi:hypothetical protein|nr:hypothetical protein [Candidatus Dojkabacteria bacterium]